MQDLKKRYLGVVYEGIKDYNGIFGKSCNTVVTIATILLGLGIIITVRHLTKIEGEIEKMRKLQEEVKRH